MSLENIETIRRGLDAFNRRDKTTWCAICDREVENFPPRDWPETASRRGAEAIWEFFVEAGEAWEQDPYEFDELIDAGSDKAVAHQRAELRGRASGAAITWDYWVVFTFRDSKVLRFEWFDERAEAFEAAGIRD